MNPELPVGLIGAIAGFVGAVLGSAITGLVQSRIAEKNRQQQLRMAALDKRLQAHQEAYHLWWRLYLASSPSDDDDIVVVANESRQWWRENCLYLEPSVREAFRRVIGAAVHRYELLESGKSRIPEVRASTGELKRVSQEVRRVGPLIEEAMGFPPISDELLESASELRKCE